MQESWPTAAPRPEIDESEPNPPFQHENIIALLNAFVAASPDSEEALYLVMEHGGTDLQSVYKHHEISLDHARFFGYQVGMFHQLFHPLASRLCSRAVWPVSVSCIHHRMSHLMHRSFGLLCTFTVLALFIETSNQAMWPSVKSAISKSSTLACHVWKTLPAVERRGKSCRGVNFIIEI